MSLLIARFVGKDWSWFTPEANKPRIRFDLPSMKE
jgi:hypothetical protein